MLAMSVRDFARIVDSKGVTSKTPFATDVALILKCLLLLATDSINSQASSGVLFFKAPPAEASIMDLSVAVKPSRRSLSKRDQRSNGHEWEILFKEPPFKKCPIYSHFSGKSMIPVFGSAFQRKGKNKSLHSVLITSSPPGGSADNIKVFQMLNRVFARHPMESQKQIDQTIFQFKILI
ncbi:hypothetical protein PIB30_092422 [Stylosanthes scabra]|uniref:Uncharacterized protein n=1 Tax=Stylosanthes scabra TaxID=79078 RepID=A0ABU6SW83_9FABA|nr:hypothetical protein [Stylosanthes scabra]